MLSELKCPINNQKVFTWPVKRRSQTSSMKGTHQNAAQMCSLQRFIGTWSVGQLTTHIQPSCKFVGVGTASLRRGIHINRNNQPCRFFITTVPSHRNLSSLGRIKIATRQRQFRVCWPSVVARHYSDDNVIYCFLTCRFLFLRETHFSINLIGRTKDYRRKH